MNIVTKRFLVLNLSLAAALAACGGEPVELETIQEELRISTTAPTSRRVSPSQGVRMNYRNLSPSDKVAMFRINDFTDLRAMIIEALRAQGTLSGRWSNETLWTNTNGCHRRSLRFVDLYRSIPLNYQNLDITILPLGTNRVRFSIDAPNAVLGGTLEYKRTKLDEPDWYCVGFNQDAYNRSIATLQGFSAVMDAKLDIHDNSLRIENVDMALGWIDNIDINTTSSGGLEAGILSSIFSFFHVLEWNELVSVYMNALAEQNGIRGKIQAAFNQVVGSVVSIEHDTESSGVSLRANLTGLNSSYSAQSITTEIRYDIESTQRTDCTSELSFIPSNTYGVPSYTNHDIDLILPRHAIDEALYSFIRANTTLCRSVPFMGHTLEIQPSGQMRSRAGFTDNSETAFIFTLPFAIIKGSNQVGALNIEAQFILQLDGENNLVISTSGTPEITYLSGSISMGGFPVDLADIRTLLQNAVDTMFAGAGFAVRLLPGMFELDQVNHRIRIEDIIQRQGRVIVSLEASFSGTGTVPSLPGGGGSRPGKGLDLDELPEITIDIDKDGDVISEDDSDNGQGNSTEPDIPSKEAPIL